VAQGDYLTVESFGDPGPQYVGSLNPTTGDGQLPGYGFPGQGPSACPYRAQLEAVGAYGAAHLERALNPATVAFEYLTDPVAHDFLIDTAEEMMLQFSHQGALPSSGWTPPNLRNYLSIAAAKPHHGGDCGRYRGIPALAVAMANKVKKRRGYHDWMEMWALWCDTVQMPNGVWQWSVGDGQFHNPPNVAACQMFETLYVAFAREAAGYGLGVVATSTLLAYSALFVNRKLPKQAYVYNQGAYGPPHFMGIGDAVTGEPYNVISTGWAAPGEVPIGDITNVEFALARAWHVSGGAEKFKRAMLEYTIPAPTIDAKKTAMLASLDLNWSCAAVSAIQAEQAQQAP
jgi:hypothetical protein